MYEATTTSGRARRIALTGVVTAALVALILTCAGSAHAWTKGAWVSQATGQCLRDLKFQGLHMGPCDSSKTTLWTASSFSISGIRYQNNDTGRCLDDSNSRFGLRTFMCQRDGGPYMLFQAWADSGMVAGNPFIQRLQNLSTGRCLYDAPGLTKPRSMTCIQHTAANWKTQAWRWSYHSHG